LDGELGDGTPIDRLAPVRVGTASNWVSVSAISAGFVSAGIKSDGSLWFWGDYLRTPSKLGPD
jgi:alpha-tubulin suppressor-like RCC1 family protein